MHTFDISAETAITVEQAARMLPSGRGADSRSPETVKRWILQGHKPRGKAKSTRIHLEGAYIGDTLVTSQESIQRFVMACSSAASNGAAKPPATVTSRRHEAAMHALKSKGF